MIQDHPKEMIPLLTVKINEVKLHYYESNVQESQTLAEVY